MSPRSGISPVLAVVVLTLIVVSMGAGVYTFITGSQEQVEEATRQVELETVNATCLPDTVTWWLNNTGKTRVKAVRADLFVFSQGGLNASLSTEDVPLGEFRQAFGAGKVAVSPPKRMALGETYSLELALGSASISTSCRVGSGWWDAEWDYRRAVRIDTVGDATVQVSLDASTLVSEGKLRSDCADIRAVDEGTVVPYAVESCDPSGAVAVRMNLSDVEPGEAYVYYGNLQAGPANISMTAPVTHTPGLGPEERVNLP